MKTWKTEKKKKLPRDYILKFLGNKFQNKNQMLKWLIAYGIAHGSFNRVIENDNTDSIMEQIIYFNDDYDLICKRTDTLMNDKWGLIDNSTIKRVKGSRFNNNIPISSIEYFLYKYTRIYDKIREPYVNPEYYRINKRIKEKRNRQNRRDRRDRIKKNV